MESAGDVEGAILVLASFLPSWLSYLLLSLLFLSVWLAPSWIGWDRASTLKYLVFLEIAGVAGLAYLLSGRDEYLGWLHVLPSGAILCVILWIYTSPLVAVVLPVHLLIRSATLWRNQRKTHEVVTALGLSLVLMGFVWLAVGLLPLPHLGWSTSATPGALWWNVLTWRGWKRIPQALPAWGFLYFFVMSLIERFDVRWPGLLHFVEWLDRDRPWRRWRRAPGLRRRGVGQEATA